MGLPDFFAVEPERKARAESIRLDNEEKQLKLDQERRSSRALDELSTYTDQFLSGPKKPREEGLSMPEQLSGPGMEQANDLPGIEKVGPNDAQHRFGFGLYQNPNILRNPEYLNGAAQIFLKHRMPQGVQWLESAYKASKENLVEATQLAVADDLPGAEKAFNSTGDHKVVPGSLKWKDDKKTVLTGVNESDGQTFEVKPKELLKSYLSPKEFFEQSRKSDEEARKVEEDKSQANLRSAQADYYRGAKSALDRAKADKLSGVDPKALNTVIQKGGLALRRQLESEQSKEDAKFNVNGMISLLPDMQKDLGEAIRNDTDPEVALAQTYNTYRDRVAGLSTALSQVSQAANSKWTDAGKNEATKEGLQKLIDEFGLSAADIKKYLPATKVGKADQERIGKVLGTLAVTGKVNAQTKIEEPQNQADFDALKPGTHYKNPSDGKTYVKK